MVIYYVDDRTIGGDTLEHNDKVRTCMKKRQGDGSRRVALLSRDRDHSLSGWNMALTIPICHSEAYEEF